MFPGLSSLVIDGVTDTGTVVRVTARSVMALAACPRCGTESRRVHAWHLRHLADLPVAGRSVMVDLRVRRLVCGSAECPQRTFREQIPQLTQRCARRTMRLTSTIGQVAITLAGRAGAALLSRLGIAVSRSTLLRTLMALPLPPDPVPPVLSVDDVALRRGHRYMTMVIDPVTHRRIEVLPDRRAATLAAWLRDRPGIEVVCRDGSAAYAEAIAQGAPEAVQVSDRWHLWHGLGAAVEKIVIAHATCWRREPAARGAATTTAPPTRALGERTRARHAAVHELLGQGVGLLECARRLGWALNTVKRYARAATAEELVRPPRYGTTLVHPYRDHLRRRLTSDPTVPVTQLLAEIRELGYPGSANLLVRYLSQGRAQAERAVPAPRRLVAWIMTRPTDLPDYERVHLDDLLASCPHLTALVEHVRDFAGLLIARRGSQVKTWMNEVESSDLPALHAFVRGLRKDLPAVIAGLTLPYSNGPIEGANTKVKLLKRQMYGRAGFALLRQRILLS
ncbi:ISL3 family transposase [Pseudonocardia sp. K10HN5]|uniref:ISL3 family transposase n=1 Tax=Pseudonocardia acidicola TaxID=2724939 RepID=A0ABX1SE54_9PSEU|nr:ISL3 family transposase [Pseudonocardia acidicola]NMH98763.1 ISL3 family transposase [Pseudonocardia acidicola]